METTVAQTGKVPFSREAKTDRIDVFRWQKWVDGDGKLWIVTLLFGYDKHGRYGANVELLNVDGETTIDVARREFEGWVRVGTLKRVDTPLLI